MSDIERLRAIRLLLTQVDDQRQAYITALSNPELDAKGVAKAREVFNDARHAFEREVRIYLTERGM